MIKKKGFTLVELLAVIIILGIISAITIPLVSTYINDSKQTAYEQLIASIEQTAQLYVRNIKDDTPGLKEVGNDVTITLQDLVDAKYLRIPITDPRNEQKISLTTELTITVLTRNQYDIEIGEIIYQQ